MAHFQRLIWFVVGLVLGGLPMFAFADVFVYGVRAMNSQSIPGVQWSGMRQGYAGGYFPGSDTKVVADAIGMVSPGNLTLPAGCTRTGNDQPPVLSGAGTRIVDGVGYSEYRYRIVLASNCGGDAEIGVAVKAGMTPPQCETGERDQYGQCFTCPEGRVWNGSTCESPCQAKAGNSYGTSNSWAMLDVDTVPSGAPTFCDGLCSVTGGKVECESVSAGGTSGDRISLGSTCTVQGPFTYTGQGCGPGGPAPMLVGVDDVEKPWWDKGLEQKDCSAQGGYWGNVNGIDACVRPQPGETFDKETSTGNETTGTSETAADGTKTEKTTSTTTECKDGKCTTTTTTTTIKDATGQQIGDPTTESKTETKPEADFCEANPQHPQCAGTKTGGAFSGGCTTGFACTGDAVQCAIARAAHTEACNQKAIADDAQGFMDGLGALEPTEAKVAEALNRDGEFDFDIAEAFQDAQQNYVSFTASCLPPMGFTFKGQTYSFNTGFICEIGDFVRLMLHLIAYMTVLRVISRAFG